MLALEGGHELTDPAFIVGIIFITALPVAVILWSWHLRHWL